jgi:hypothetical protein
MRDNDVSNEPYKRADAKVGEAHGQESAGTQSAVLTGVSYESNAHL